MEWIRNRFYFILFLASTYHLIGYRGENGFLADLTILSKLKEEKYLPFLALFTLQIKVGLEQVIYIFYFLFSLTAPFGTDRNGNSINPDPFASLTPRISSIFWVKKKKRFLSLFFSK